MVWGGVREEGRKKERRWGGGEGEGGGVVGKGEGGGEVRGGGGREKR